MSINLGWNGLALTEYIRAVFAHIAAALGLVQGVDPEVKFGYGGSIPATGLHDVWPGVDHGQVDYVFPPDAGAAIEAVSDQAADVYDVTIIGLGVDGLEQTETVTLTGLTPVQVPGLWRSVHRAYNDNGIEFVGHVFIRDSGGGNIYAVVPPEDQQTVQCPYIVPADSIAVIKNYSTAINKSTGQESFAIMRLTQQRPGKVPRTVIRYGLQTRGTSNISSDLIIPVVLPPLTKIRVTADPSVSMDISAEYSMTLFKKSEFSDLNIHS